MRLLMLVNTLANVNPFIYENHRAFWAETVRRHKDPNSINLFTFTPPRMSIDVARNVAAKQALQLECDYLLFIDDDVMVPMNTVEELISCNADIAAGLVIIRGYPFDVMAFKKGENGEWPFFNDIPLIDIEPEIKSEDGKIKPAIQGLKKYVTQDDGLIGVGFSCCLIKTDLIKDIPPPWFVTGPRNTEDVYFCQKALNTIKRIQETEDSEYPDLKICMNTAVRPGHLPNAEPITWDNRTAFKTFYATIAPDLTKKIKEGGRDLEYIKMHLRGN